MGWCFDGAIYTTETLLLHSDVWTLSKSVFCNTAYYRTMFLCQQVVAPVGV